MTHNSFFKSFFLALAAVFFASCDTDSNEIGTNIVGDDNFNLTATNYGVNASTVELGPIASSGLGVNPLGIYDNDIFGKTIYNFATQVQLVTEAPLDFTLTPVIKSVVLTIPYFSTLQSTDATSGAGTYKLDSIFPKNLADASRNFRLNIYRSGNYMSNINANGLIEYNTADNASFFANKMELLAENGSFSFSPAEILETADNEDGVATTTRFAPRMQFTLNEQIFTQLFSAANQQNFLNNNLFKQYFKGLYFQVESNGQEGQLAMLNFAAGKITVKYEAATSSNTPARIEKSFVINLTGNTASLPVQVTPPAIPDTNGKLILRGGQGSMAVIDLFPGTNELEEMRLNKRLINDASLTFYVDVPTMKDVNENVEPRRIYLYDLNNNRPILDYYSDQNTNSIDPKLSKGVHGGILEKSSDGKGFKYKIRLTNHIRSLVKNADSTNVRLGLVVTENINGITNKNLVTPVGTIKKVPLMSVVHPFGIVLWGSGAEVPEDKRLKLQVYYTKPN